MEGNMYDKFSLKQVVKNFMQNIRWLIIIFVLVVLSGLLYNFYVSKSEPETIYSKGLIVYVESENGDGYHIANSINSMLYENSFTDKMNEYCMEKTANSNINWGKNNVKDLSTHTITSNNNYIKITTNTKNIELSEIIMESYREILETDISAIVEPASMKYVEQDINKSEIVKGYGLSKAIKIYSVLGIAITLIVTVIYSFCMHIQKK